MKLKKKITLSRIVKQLLLLLIIYWVWGAFQQTKMYIVGSYGAIKIEVPLEIVKSKDCKEYKKFIDKITRPGFVPNSNYPWAKVGKIGYFTLNGVEFAVPGEYLWQGSKDPDGKSDGLYFMFKYPSFVSASASGDQSMNVKVTVKPEVIEDINHENLIIINPAQRRYFSRSGIDSRLEELLASKNLGQYIKAAPEVGMKAFVHKGRIRSYFTGDLLHPKEWMRCDSDVGGVIPHCEGSFMYRGNNNVDFFFKRRGLMQDHWNIRKQIKAKLDEFCKKRRRSCG